MFGGMRDWQLCSRRLHKQKEKNMKRIAVSLIGLLFASASIEASDTSTASWHTTPLQLSLGPPIPYCHIQLAPEDWDVRGLRLNLGYGNNKNVHGIDVGGFNFVTSEAVGVQIGAGNSAGEMKGIQFGLFNDTHGDCCGSQIGFKNHCMRSLTGVQLGLINERGADDKTMRMMGAANEFNRAAVGSGLVTALSSGDFAGVQVGIYNGTYSCSMKGVQFGLHNYATDIRGLQIGLLNRAVAMTGIQIGIVNIITESPLSFLPIVNAHF